MASGEKTLGATLTAALFVQTIGSVDPVGGGGSDLPSPSRYIATWVVWGVLGFVASLGDKFGKLAAQFSVLLLLTMMTMGPFGAKMVAFLNGIARRYRGANT